MFKQFPPCPFKPKLLNVTIDEHAPDPFQKQIYDLEELEAFAVEFKSKRLKLGFTQGDVGQSIGAIYGTNFSQATISRFEALALSFHNMCKLKPILGAWMEVADKEDYKPCVGWASNRFCARVDVTNLDRVQRQRRRRAVFEKNVLITLEKAFNANPRPTVEELDCISESLKFEKEIVRIWFCNRRAKIQRALKAKLMDERRLVEASEIPNIKEASDENLSCNGIADSVTDRESGLSDGARRCETGADSKPSIFSPTIDAAFCQEHAADFNPFESGGLIKKSFSNTSLYTIYETSFFGPEDCEEDGDHGGVGGDGGDDVESAGEQGMEEDAAVQESWSRIDLSSGDMSLKAQ